MSASQLFESLKRLELRAGDFAVFGSGPLAIRGLVDDPGDLDVLCRGAAWWSVRQLARDGVGVLKRLPEYDDVEVITLGRLSFGTRWGIGDFDVDDLIDTSEWIAGLPFVRLEHVVSYKRQRRSPRDLEHLALVDHLDVAEAPRAVGRDGDNGRSGE